MSEYNTSRTRRYLPQVAIATTVVTIVPVLIVWSLLAEGVISSPWVCLGLAIALSLAASLAGSAYWKRRGGHSDIFFSELLLWGWLRRLRGERKLARALGRLGLGEPNQELVAGAVTVERKEELLRQMAAALDAQDPYTDGHSRRVAVHSALVARRMHLPDEEVAKVRTAAAVHDIGKLRIPREVLYKPEALTPEEFGLVKRHADDGAQIVSSMEDPEITAMVRHHHERFDGAGYPAGLVGEQTPIGARIIAVADTFDALTSIRPYRAPISHKRALDVIAAASGTQLDPVVARTFIRCYSAKKVSVFWALSTILPERALAWLRVRTPGQGSLASAGTLATPAVIAAAFGIAFGSSNTVFPSNPLALAKGAPSHRTGARASHRARRRFHSSPRTNQAPILLAALRAGQTVPASRVNGGGGLATHLVSLGGTSGGSPGLPGGGSGTGGPGAPGGGRGKPGGTSLPISTPGAPIVVAPISSPTTAPNPAPVSGAPSGSGNPPAGTPGRSGSGTGGSGSSGGGSGASGGGDAGGSGGSSDSGGSGDPGSGSGSSGGGDNGGSGSGPGGSSGGSGGAGGDSDGGRGDGNGHAHGGHGDGDGNGEGHGGHGDGDGDGDGGGGD